MPNEVAYLLLCYSSQGLDFCPFGEIIYCYDDKFALALSNGQGSQSVQPPLLLKRPGGCNRHQWLGWEVRDFSVFLINFAFSDYFCCVSEHCGLIVPLPQDFSRQCPSSDVVSTYAFMYFPQHVVGVFPFNALEDGCEKTSLIKGSLMNSEPGRPRLKLRCLLRVVWQ